MAIWIFHMLCLLIPTCWNCGKKLRTIDPRTLKAMLGHMAKHGYPDTFPDDGSILNTTKTQGCSYIPFTPEEYNLILTNSFWLEEVFQTAIGLLGIIGNLTAITIYCTSGSKFYTIFYRLLISLLFVHTAYIVLQVMLYFGRYSQSREQCYKTFLS